MDSGKGTIKKIEPDERKVSMFIMTFYALLFFAAVMGAGWWWDSTVHHH